MVFRALRLFVARPSPMCTFPGLRTLAIALARSHEKVDGPLAVPFSPLSLCPNLTALDLHLLHCTAEMTAPVLASLSADLPLLRTLRVTCRLSSEQFLSLLSLPLTCLDLQLSEVDLNTVPPIPFPLNGLTTFLYPLQLCDLVQTAPDNAVHWHEALMSSLAAGQGDGGESALERLQLHSLGNVEDLSYLLHLRRLHTLHVSGVVLLKGDQLMLDFFGTLLSSPLPLRHLRLHSILVTDEELDTTEWSVQLFTLLTAFLSAYAEQLVSLDLTFVDRQKHSELPPADLVQALTAALLSCHALRRLRVADSWLSIALPTPPTAALPQLELLEVDVAVGGIDEATLAVLLDAAPHLQELTLKTRGHLFFELLFWVGERCHELRTLRLQSNSADAAVKFRWLSAERWKPISPFPSLPLLTVLIVGSIVSARACDLDERRLLFERVASYLVHSTPSLQFLRLPLQRWLNGDLQPLCRLRGLTQLRGIWVGDEEWTHAGPLQRCWMGYEEARKAYMLIERMTKRANLCLWGQEPLLRIHWPWRELGQTLRGEAMHEEEVLAELELLGWEMPRFKEREDGSSGAVAFFDEIERASSSATPRALRALRRRRDCGGEDGEDENGAKRGRISR